MFPFLPLFIISCHQRCGNDLWKGKCQSAHYDKRCSIEKKRHSAIYENEKDEILLLHRLAFFFNTYTLLSDTINE